MKTSEIIEGNRIIEEFMGIPHKLTDSHLDNELIRKGFQYHSSWNWIMPVVEKIEYFNHFVQIVGYECIIYRHGRLAREAGQNALFMNQEETKILAVYVTIVEFIKWYNEQPK